MHVVRQNTNLTVYKKIENESEIFRNLQMIWHHRHAVEWGPAPASTQQCRPKVNTLTAYNLLDVVNLLTILNLGTSE
jgi:hypothetical protein